MALGAVASGVGCVLTVLTEQTLPLYIVELGLSGIGWNFLFNGGTLLLASTYPAARKTRAQGLNSLFVYSANLLASFSAGALMASYGWPVVNLPACRCLHWRFAGAVARVKHHDSARSSGAVERR